MTSEELVHDIHRYQSCEYVHPLTCYVATHENLQPFVCADIVFMQCPTCGTVTRPPDIDFKQFVTDVSKAFQSR